VGHSKTRNFLNRQYLSRTSAFCDKISRTDTAKYPRKYLNLLPVKSKMADGDQILITGISNISGKAKARDFKFGAKLGYKG